jgi:hypothetical protein
LEALLPSKNIDVEGSVDELIITFGPSVVRPIFEYFGARARAAPSNKQHTTNTRINIFQEQSLISN